MSRTAVCPMEVEEPAQLPPVAQQPGVGMEEVPGKPATLLGLGLQSVQFGCAAITVVIIMASIDIRNVPSLGFLVASSGMVCLWSISLAMLDIYALSVQRRLRRLDWFFTVGDGIMGALMFTAASMAGGISDFIMSDRKGCATNDCAIYVISTVFAFFSFFALLLSVRGLPEQSVLWKKT